MDEDRVYSYISSCSSYDIDIIVRIGQYLGGSEYEEIVPLIFTSASRMAISRARLKGMHDHLQFERF